MSEKIKRLARLLNAEEDEAKVERKFLEITKRKNVVSLVDALSKYCDRHLLLNNIAAVFCKHREEGLTHCYPLVAEFLENHYSSCR